MKEEALIIFVRKPVLGTVKTRLAAALGPEAALAIYQQLLAHTHRISRNLPCDKYVFYSGVLDEEDCWQEGYLKQQQAGGNLGEKMKASFAFLFGKGYRRVCIIGSDCFELTTEVINNAFTLLHQTDTVIGPAKDGGYYLLGMSGGLKEVFNGIAWSTGKVFSQTVALLDQQGLSYGILPLFSDVDTIDDVPEKVLADLDIKVKR